MKRLFALLSACLAMAAPASADEVTVAVAANFLSTAQNIANDFHDRTGHSVTLSSGSTGQLYAQIVAGAPYDIFLSADEARPDKLKAEGLAEEVKTYALGRLVLVSRMPVDPADAAAAFAGKTVALADPLVAPYGRAATQAMERLHLDTATFRPVLVANVGQVASVFQSGNADMAFVAASQAATLNAPYTLALDGRYSPIRQDAALLKRGDGNAAAAAFWAALFSPETEAVISAAGYGTAE